MLCDNGNGSRASNRQRPGAHLAGINKSLRRSCRQLYAAFPKGSRLLRASKKSGFCL